MIRDARVLRAGFVPREVEHRDQEVNHLSSVLEPITNGEPADTAIVTGPSGTGKTCISQFVTERLREEVLDVEATYWSCQLIRTHPGDVLLTALLSVVASVKPCRPQPTRIQPKSPCPPQNGRISKLSSAKQPLPNEKCSVPGSFC